MSEVDRQADLKAKNQRLALILASVAAVFFLGFLVKMAWFPHH
ncbi:MAG: cytochrome oxidase small assembly protein [Burkholderiales bacterium]|nr:cytochrome oxidase small assembly protein [Burkholderiales bacterium]MDE2432413.1 cytochrome oxidase small assembly protein [Burkholderiales bacterium]HET8694268.1 cytochrome oxidase small assembly protein [Aquabacterium sp.]